MQNFEAIIHQKPHAVRAAFISDTHLSPRTADINAAFIALVTRLQHLPNLQALYILGDWLDAWPGDDDYLHAPDIHWLHPIICALKVLGARTDIFIMHGNRDFAITQRLCQTFGGTLIYEPYVPITSPRIRLEHGDALCSDDISYQRYRRIIRHPVILKGLLALPLSLRKKIAGEIKLGSQTHKAQKKLYIMDVNTDAVHQALSNCDILIHGHTHRPNLHVVDNKKRLVLGDWRRGDKNISAVIALWLKEHEQDTLLLSSVHHCI